MTGSEGNLQISQWSLQNLASRCLPAVKGLAAGTLGAPG
jgi:hypothetical protein